MQKLPAGPAPRSLPGGAERFSRQWWLLAGILGATLLVLFIKGFEPGQVLFDNDDTLGQMKAVANRLPSGFAGMWHPGTWLGNEGPSRAPTVSAILMMFLSPEIYLKVYAPFSMFFLGFSAWLFFRQLGFKPAVCLLGGFAAGLNMHFFSNACWGLGAWNIAAGTTFLALAALCSKSIPQLWARAVLAGLAVGMNLMEGFDVGVILSVYVGLFIVWQIFTAERPGTRDVARALCTEALVIFFSAFIAAHSIATLVGTEVKGVSGESQDEETKEQRWDPNTRWSLPKLETLRIVTPGLFGYRMAARINTPDKSSAYWGNVGQDPRVTALRSDDPGQRDAAVKALSLPPEQSQNLNNSDPQARATAISALMKRVSSVARYSGSGEYAGMLVSLLAIFAVVNSCRGVKSPYGPGERRALWFWTAAAFISLLAAWGRFAFFYRWLYQLPYVSTMRNPIKFLHPFHVAWLILAAYGMEALWRRYMQTGPERADILPAHITKWWSKAPEFEKKWSLALGVLFCLSLVALYVYSDWKPHLIEYLTLAGIDPARAVQIADFSIGEAGWFVFWLFVSSVVIVGIMSGAWTGSQTGMAAIYVGVIIIADLARADIPWIHYFDYRKEYSENSVVDFLKDKPYEHRVMGRMSPKGMGSGIRSSLGQLYDYWQQNEFPYYSIQSLDFAQWPRIPVLDANYMKKFALSGTDVLHCDLWPAERLWQLTNTRYILTSAIVSPALNQYADNHQGFQINTFLSVMSKPGLSFLEDAGEMTAMPDTKGPYALVEFTNTLPRAKLYSHWESAGNDDATLDLLASHKFHPEETVLVAQDTPVGQPTGDSLLDPGDVSIIKYSPKDIRLQAHASKPAVLLFNDRFGPQWMARVDQQPAKILRCNYLMRGVYLTPGDHTVEFRFHTSRTTLCVSLCAWGVGILTAGYLIYSRAPVPVSAPISPSNPSPPAKASPAPRPAAAAPVKQKKKKQPAAKK